MKLRRGDVTRSSFALSVALGAAAVACSRPARVAPQPAAKPSPAFESMEPVADAQRHAQRTWCAYLDALYHRATQDGTSWGQLDRCNTEASTASPEMLERTAACSQLALQQFTGDPFTEAYASEVKQCGATVVEAMALPTTDVEPYVTLACQRASTCGQATIEGCRSEVTERLGKRLGRALGAVNAESRIALRQCLQTAACKAVDDQISDCLDPILDRLLWTPG